MLTICFDAGTLLVSETIKQYAGHDTIPDLLWDKRVGSFRAPAYRYFHIIRFLEELKIPYTDQARGYERINLSLKIKQEPRPFQKQAIINWKDAYFRGYITLPTGAGKTYVALLAMEMMKKSTLVVAPTIDLMNQWYSLICAYFDIEVGIIGGGYHEVRPVSVTTYDSAYMQMEHIGNRFGLIIFDECHHLPSPAYGLAAKMSIAPFRMGLSATPERVDGRHLDLPDLIGQQVYEEEIKNLSGNYLSPYDTERLYVDLLDDEREEYERERKVYRDFVKKNNISFGTTLGWQRFIWQAARSMEGREALKAYQRQRRIALNPRGKINLLRQLMQEHRGERILIFTSHNATVYTISKTFFIPAITHQTKTKERKDILEGFAKGAYPVLATSKVLNEGIDVPEASVGIILSGSGSVREHVQRLGRILRARPGKRAMLYEVVSRDTAEEYTSSRRREHGAYQ